MLRAFFGTLQKRSRRPPEGLLEGILGKNVIFWPPRWPQVGPKTGPERDTKATRKGTCVKIPLGTQLGANLGSFWGRFWGRFGVHFEMFSKCFCCSCLFFVFLFCSFLLVVSVVFWGVCCSCVVCYIKNSNVISCLKAHRKPHRKPQNKSRRARV